jgi:AraC-like DNA-binding protein
MTTPYIPLLRVSTLLPFVNFLEEVGTPTEKLLKQCQLPIFALDDPNLLISRHQAFVFIEKAALLEGIPNLGCLVGEKTPFTALGSFGRLVCQSMTLYDAIHTMTRLEKQFNSDEHYWLVEEGEKAYLCQKYGHIEEIGLYYGNQFSLSMMIHLIRIVAGQSWYPSEVLLQSRQKKNFSEHFLSQVQIQFDRGLTAVGFPRSFLYLPFPSSPNSVSRQQYPDYQILQTSAPFLTFSQSLGQVILSHLKEGYPSIQLAAEIAQMSVRTLQRRLADEGLAYSQLITRLRYDRAVELLEDSSLKIIEISQELAYEDPAHFTRAFKRWTGVSPRDFRHFSNQ